MYAIGVSLHASELNCHLTTLEFRHADTTYSYIDNSSVNEIEYFNLCTTDDYLDRQSTVTVLDWTGGLV